MPRTRHGASRGTLSASRGRIARWIPLAALWGLGIALYARGFAVGFVGDDYTLLDAARRVPLLELLSGRHGIVGYYRPISRELYFWWWGKALALGPFGFHLVNAATYAATLLVVHRFIAGWQGARVAGLAVLALLVYSPTGALLSWISCAQDLIALGFGAAAFLLHRARRYGWSGAAVALAALSKETGVVVPFGLAAFEWIAGERSGSWRTRATRLLPAFAGLAAAVAIAVGVRATWPAGTAVAVWSPRQALGAWAVPGDFLSTFWPPSTGPGIAAAWRASPVPLVLAAIFAILAVPGRSRGYGTAPLAESHRGRGGRGGAIAFGLAMTLIGMLPIAFIVERWRGYFFTFTALGAAIALAATLARVPAAARILAAGAAVACFGANTVYRPIEAAYAPGRHAHANWAFFREADELGKRILGEVAPYCDEIRAVPKVFTAGVPQEFAMQNILGPGLRVTCRDTALRLVPLDTFAAPDARAEFGVLEYDAETVRFGYRRADPRLRFQLGERFLRQMKLGAAVACFEAAAEGGDPTIAAPARERLAELAPLRGHR